MDLVLPDPAKLAALCRRHRVRTLSVFGSAASGKAGPTSDLDLLVEFDQAPGYFGLAALQRALADLTGQSVDLRTPAELSPYFRDEVRAEARLLYDVAYAEAAGPEG